MIKRISLNSHIASHIVQLGRVTLTVSSLELQYGNKLHEYLERIQLIFLKSTLKHFEYMKKVHELDKLV